MASPVIRKPVPRKMTPQPWVLITVLFARVSRVSAELSAFRPASPQSWMSSPSRTTSLEPVPFVLDSTQLAPEALTSRLELVRNGLGLRYKGDAAAGPAG